MSASEENQNDANYGAAPSSATESPDAPAQPVYGFGEGMLFPPECRPKVDHLITEDDTPVDSVYTEKQQRLLTEPLYSSWAGPGEGRTFVAMANVGLFFLAKNPALVPDCLLAVDVELPEDAEALHAKEHRSYYVWEYGRVPHVIVEIVSDRMGGEDTVKLWKYGRQGIPYYVIYDPHNLLKGGVMRRLELRGDQYEPRPDDFFPAVHLGLIFWEGEYEGMRGRWLRWCDREGRVIPTGREGREQERQRAEQERQRAEQERQRAEQARRETEAEKERNDRLRAQLRALGIEPAE
jgi:Uma2 family endonuclease